MRRSLAATVSATALVLLLASAPARAQQTLGVIALERLSLLDQHGTGARAFGMGGAYTALSDDVLGLLYNPAGIVWSGGREVSLGIHQRWEDVEQTYDGYRSGTSGAFTAFGHIGAVFPYSTYTTDIYFGFGVFRTGNSGLEYVREGLREDLGGTLRNVLLQSGSVYQYRFAVAAALTPGICAGAALAIWDGSPRFVEEISFETPGDYRYTFSDDVSADLDGISFDIGLHARLGRYIDAGFVVTSPAWLEYRGSGVERYFGTWHDGADWTEDPYHFRIEDDFTLPLSLRAGAALQTEVVTISAEASYSDYRQTRYNGLKLRYDDDPRINVLKQIVSFRTGAEVRIPGSTVALRAGYAREPLPYRGGDEITWIEDTWDEYWLVTEWGFTTVRQERRFFTAGAGILIDGALAVDVALRLGSFERESEFLLEKREISEFIAAVAYRF